MGFGEYKDGKLASYVMVNEFESRIFAKSKLDSGIFIAITSIKLSENGAKLEIV